MASQRATAVDDDVDWTQSESPCILEAAVLAGQIASIAGPHATDEGARELMQIAAEVVAEAVPHNEVLAFLGDSASHEARDLVYAAWASATRGADASLEILAEAIWQDVASRMGELSLDEVQTLAANLALVSGEGNENLMKLLAEEVSTRSSDMTREQLM
eukprot:gnl/MRDRNA2_/MRDRNA2_332871_c0_seq1.p1 gnl/MRDRNA2_/MRDRNA2_332871_c0~~gnl/MRDRNA2_/MRDRNA2_332871_c0_seq1.p1  ORF type:complete len:160 (-),score=39.35 gnl/MRDRNA2_/MRDRNA2_332871_c0_seq1:24-503(-)